MRLSEVGGKGLFSTNIEKELQDKKIDIAVHALKDMPAIETVEEKLELIEPTNKVEDEEVKSQEDLEEKEESEEDNREEDKDE